VPKVKGTKMTVFTCFGPVFIGLKWDFLYYQVRRQNQWTFDGSWFVPARHLPAMLRNARRAGHPHALLVIRI